MRRDQRIEFDTVVYELGAQGFMTQRGIVVEGNYRIGDKVAVIFDKKSRRYLPAFKREKPPVVEEEEKRVKQPPTIEIIELESIKATFDYFTQKIYFTLKEVDSKHFYITLPTGPYPKMGYFLSLVEYAPFMGAFLYRYNTAYPPYSDVLEVMKFKVLSTKTDNSVVWGGKTYYEHEYEYAIDEFPKPIKYSGEDRDVTPPLLTAEIGAADFPGKGVWDLFFAGYSFEISFFCAGTFYDSNHEVLNINGRYNFSGQVYGNGMIICENPLGGGETDYPFTYTYSMSMVRTLLDHYIIGTDCNLKPIGMGVWLTGAAVLSNLKWKIYATFDATYEAKIKSVQTAVMDGSIAWPCLHWENIATEYYYPQYLLKFGVVIEKGPGGIIYTLDDVYRFADRGLVHLEYNNYGIGETEWAGIVVLDNTFTLAIISENYYVFGTHKRCDDYFDAFPVLSIDGTLFNTWIITFGEVNWVYVDQLLNEFRAFAWLKSKASPNDTDMTWLGSKYNFGYSRHLGGGHANRAMCRILPRCLDADGNDKGMPFYNKSLYWIGEVFKNWNDNTFDQGVYGRNSKELLIAKNRWSLVDIPAVDSQAVNYPINSPSQGFTWATYVEKMKMDNDLSGTTEGSALQGCSVITDFGIIRHGWAT